MKNFMISGLLLAGLLIGGGCASVHKGVYPNGNQFYEFGTFPLGGNAKSSTVLNIVNSAQNVKIQIFWDGEEITSGPLSPHKILTYRNNTAWVGEQVNLMAQLWDMSLSRAIGEMHSVTLTMNFGYWGVASNNWTFIQEGGRVRSKTYGPSFGEYGGGFGFGRMW
ncbi:MAG: hypothetical protein AAB736_01695 [Patescibacteria group bacterium]